MKLKEIAEAAGYDYKFLCKRGQGYISVFCPSSVDTIIANKIKTSLGQTSATITQQNVIRIGGNKTTVNFFFKGLSEEDQFETKFNH